MASAFSSWEMDPFFAAAEDVQHSADRMESAYRIWMYKKALAEEGSSEQRSAKLSSREVATALDTTKWQLEEFRKAVTNSAQSNTFPLGEDVSKRHFSFIAAIQDQISLIENTLRDCIDIHFSNSLHSVNFNDEERDQLAMFLSGCPSIPASDVRIHPLEEKDSLLISSKLYAPISDTKRTLDVGHMSNHYGGQASGLPSSSNERLDNGCESEHESCLEIVEESKVPVKRLNGTKPVQESGLQDASWDGSLEQRVFIPTNHLIEPETTVRGLIGSLAEVNGSSKLQSYRNGFRRWKNGYHHIDNKEDIALVRYNKLQPDIEEGPFTGDPRSKRRSSLQNAIGRWRVRQLLVACYVAACNSSGRKATVVVVALCFCCMYFWFLSSLVPYMNTVFPYKFQD